MTIQNQEGQQELGLSSRALSAVISLFERLGICIAVGVGGFIITKFPEVAFPPLPIVATVLGLIIFVGAFFLTIWVAGDFAARLWHPHGGRFTLALTIFAVLLLAVCFVSAGITAAAHAVAH